MKKHTLGLWTVNGGDDVWIGDRICIHVGDEDDARLISAAPDLLKALEYSIKQVPELASVPGISAAIAKARGKE